MSGALDPREAKALLHGPAELAFLDVREAGEFGEGHPLFTVPCPYSRLELLAPRLVPNRRAPMLLIDGGDGVAERARSRLADFGYENVATVAGGAPAWEAAGLTLFKGVNVPGKTLGELAEAAWHPATIDAATLRDWQRSGRSFLLFDARPPAEHSKMRLPGARCLPNGELAHRLAAAVPAAETPIVVACAGRTRGLVGAIALRLAGAPNPVFALENGTQGWALAGEELERGRAADPYPALDAADVKESRVRARRFSAEWNIPWLDAAGLAALRADPSRTLFLFDVRSAEEFRRGHLPGAVHAPGGQLVQASDHWIGVRRARIVLADDSGLRAALAAFWLRQLGWEVFVLAEEALFDEGNEASHALPSTLEPIAPESAAAGMEAGTHVLLDLRPSGEHRAGHPAGAQWTIRPRLASALAGHHGAIVLLADEPKVAELASIDIAELSAPLPLVGRGWGRGDAAASFAGRAAAQKPSPRPSPTRGEGERSTGSEGDPKVFFLDGGLAAWRAAGLPVEASPDRPTPEEAIDFLRFVHDRHDGNLESSLRYLAWEQGLVAQLDAEERAEFRLARPRI